MSNMTPEQDQLLRNLQAFQPEHFRKQRWLMIHRAREAGIGWEAIGEALDTPRTAAVRMYTSGKKAMQQHSAAD